MLHLLRKSIGCCPVSELLQALLPRLYLKMVDRAEIIVPSLQIEAECEHAGQLSTS